MVAVKDLRGRQGLLNFNTTLAYAPQQQADGNVGGHSLSLGLDTLGRLFPLFTWQVSIEKHTDSDSEVPMMETGTAEKASTASFSRRVPPEPTRKMA